MLHPTYEVRHYPAPIHGRRDPTGLPQSREAAPRPSPEGAPVPRSGFLRREAASPEPRKGEMLPPWVPQTAIARRVRSWPAVLLSCASLIFGRGQSKRERLDMLRGVVNTNEQVLARLRQQPAV